MSSEGAYSRYTAPGPRGNSYGHTYAGDVGITSGYGCVQSSAGDANFYGETYIEPKYSSGSLFYNQCNTGKEMKSKGTRKSIALQALNKNVLIWAGFFTVSLFVYFVLSGGDFSFLMTYGAMSRMFGFGILNVKTFKSRRVTGVSAKTLQLYSLVFFFRLTSIVRHEGYLPYDRSGDWLYHLIEIMGLVFTASAFWACRGPFKSTYEFESDKFGEFHVPRGYGALYLAIPVFIVAVVLHPSLNSDFFSDVAWTYAMYLESVSLIPQLYMFQKQTNGIVELLTAHFVAALGFGRIMELIFWVYSYHELATTNGSTLPGYLALFSQLMQLLLMIDFFWYYFSAVKNATPLVLPSHNVGGNIV